MTKRPSQKATGELMSTSIIFLRETDPVSLAAREMALSSIRHLPVVDAGGRLVGLVSSTDVQAAFAAEGDPALGTLMTRDVRTVGRDTPAEIAVELMIEQKFSSVPVVAEDGVLVGIVTATDFLVVAYQALTGAPIGREKGEI